MSRLVLHFSDNTLFMLEQTQTSVLDTSYPLEMDKPFAKERLSNPIKEALLKSTLGPCFWFGPGYTLFPRALFDPSQLTAYYELNHGPLQSQDYLNYQILEELDLVFIYSLPVWLYDYAKYDLQVSSVKHSIAHQLQYLKAQNSINRVILLIEKTHFVLICFKNRQLLSCTTNEYQQVNDLLYFLLAQQQKLQLPTHAQLDLYDASSNFDFKSFEALLKQFKDFEHYQTTFYDTPTYQNQILCASFEVL
jgi:hypothetical protein